MQLACGRLQQVLGANKQSARSRVVVQAAAGRRRGRGSPTPPPQIQILERSLKANDPSQPPSAPMKVEQVARFLDGELRQLFRTGVRQRHVLHCMSMVSGHQAVCGKSSQCIQQSSPGLHTCCASHPVTALLTMSCSALAQSACTNACLHTQVVASAAICNLQRPKHRPHTFQTVALQTSSTAQQSMPTTMQTIHAYIQHK